MFIKLLKDTNGNITGFISHIPKDKLWKHRQESLREVPDSDYKTLFYYLLGREHVKEKDSIGSVKIGGMRLKDEGDKIKQHEKLQKDIFKHKPNHLLN